MTEKQVQDAFLRICERLAGNRDEIIRNLKVVRASLDNTKELEDEERRLSGELDVVVEMIQSTVREEDLSGLKERYEKTNAMIRQVQQDLAMKRRRIREIEEYIGSLKELGCMGFSEAIWCSMVQRVDVSNSDMTFTMADGSVIKEEIA